VHHKLLALLTCLTVLLAAQLFAAGPVAAQVRIKDIADLEGVRDNQLIGYGLVVGLNGTGDKLDNDIFTRESLVGMLERLGVNTRDQIAKLETKNLAAVMVTGELPPFARSGSRIDIAVSSLGDATNLTGGTLLVTPLLAADGEVYAVAQGALATGAIAARGGAGSVTRGVPTAGRIAAGAIVEKETGFQLDSMTTLRLTLRNPYFTTARRIAQAIDGAFPGTAVAENPTIVMLRAPSGRSMVSFVTDVEDLDISPESPAKVVIDEVSGVVVMGADVRISQVAIAQGNLTISVQETPHVSQPLPFSQGQTTVTPNSKVKVDEEKGKKLLIVGGGASLSTLVQGLNALGVTPRDMISILQAIKASGALQADISVR
jgi:flagellar P-ring protein FlgI